MRVTSLSETPALERAGGLGRGLADEIGGADGAGAVAVLVAGARVHAGAGVGAGAAVAVAGEVAGLLLLELHDLAGQGVDAAVILEAVGGELELVDVDAAVAVEVGLEPADVRPR